MKGEDVTTCSFDFRFRHFQDNLNEVHGSWLLLLLFSCSAVSDSFVTPRTAASQAPRSMGFFRQEHRSGLPCPSPGDLPSLGIELAAPALAGQFFTTEPPGKLLPGFQMNIKSVKHAYKHMIMRTVNNQKAVSWRTVSK